MALRTLSAKNAAKLDEWLMTTGAFSLDQLMELAGLSVAQAVYKLQPPSPSPDNKTPILIACGPGNNGGDGLVAARHLHLHGYAPHVFYPKPGRNPLYQRLTTQLTTLSIPIHTSLPPFQSYSLIIDAIFGFSFSGEIRHPFPPVIAALAETAVPVLAVDAPSSWDIETGPPGDGPGKGYSPGALISLTAPKPLVKWFKGRHFVGGRFLSKAVAEHWELDVPEYVGLEQVVEVTVEGAVES